MHEKRLKSLERKQIMATGGGPPPQQDPPQSEDISAWLPNEFVIDTNEFDSDQINQVTYKSCFCERYYTSLLLSQLLVHVHNTT